MVIVFRYTPEGVAGVAKSAEAMAIALAAAGNEVTVIARTPQAEEVDEVKDGVRIFRLPLSLELKEAGQRLIELCREIKPQLMEVHLLTGFPWQDILVCKEISAATLIHHLHIYSLICQRSTLFFKGKTCSSLCEGCEKKSNSMKEYTAKVDGVVSVSQYVLEVHQREGHFNDIPTMVLPIAAPVQKLVGRREHGGKPVVGYCGRIAPTKGLEWLMSTCAKMHLPLHIAGRGEKPYVLHLQKAFAFPELQWKGWVKVEEFFSTVDILAVPSLWEEPLGRIVLEAHSFGLPVLISKVGGMGIWLQEGVNGWGIHPADPQSLERALRAYMAGPPPEPAAVQQSMLEYTPEKVLVTLNQFYSRWRHQG